MGVVYRDGHVIQTIFPYEGRQYWAGADYYKDGDGYLVHYQVGLVGSWFSTNFDYSFGNPAFEKIVCSESEITNKILNKIESQKNAIVKRLHLAIYLIRDRYFLMRDQYGNDKNKEYKIEAENLTLYPEYHPFEGIRRSIFISGPESASKFATTGFIGSSYYFCHFTPFFETVEILATKSNSGGIHIFSLPSPSGDHIADRLYDFICNNAHKNVAMLSGDLALLATKKDIGDFQLLMNIHGEKAFDFVCHK